MDSIKVAVIGTGLIGYGWAIVFAKAGHEVALYDVNAGQTEAAMTRIAEVLPDLVRSGLIDEQSNLLSRMTVCPTLEDALAGAAYIQESGPERVDLKRQIFTDLDRVAAPDAVIATSSSGISISKIAGALPSQSRCIVAHPVNPPYLIPLVEIVPAPFTDAAIVERTRHLLEKAGQVPIILRKEIDGFVLNRLQGALLREAFRLVEDGVATAEDADKTVRDGLGLRWCFMGPFETIDLNAPEGIADYVRRLGKMYLDFAMERGAPKPWGADLVERIEAERRERLKSSELVQRAAWRDLRLMALAVHKAGEEEKAGS
jgi:3-hydroxyacyl-CoA dehydrogenase